MVRLNKSPGTRSSEYESIHLPKRCTCSDRELQLSCCSSLHAVSHIETGVESAHTLSGRFSLPIPLSVDKFLIREKTTVASKVQIMNKVKSEYCQYSSSNQKITQKIWKTDLNTTATHEKQETLCM